MRQPQCLARVQTIAETKINLQVRASTGEHESYYWLTSLMN